MRMWLLLFTLLMIVRADAQEASSPGTGSIHGKITPPGHDDFVEDMLRARTLNRYEIHGHDQKPVPPYTLAEKCVIFLESDDDRVPHDAPAEHPRLNQRDMMFRPLVLPVIVGTTVDFPNNDDLFHNVFSYSQPKEFDLGRYPQGQKKSIRFDKPGIVKVYCDIHSYMYATIIVLKNPFFAVPDNEGIYRIDNIPPGTYYLSFWYGRNLVESKTISIREGEMLTRNFSP